MKQCQSDMRISKSNLQSVWIHSFPYAESQVFRSFKLFHVFKGPVKCGKWYNEDSAVQVNLITVALYMTSWHFHIYSLCHTLVALSTVQSDTCSSKSNHWTAAIIMPSTCLLVLSFEITLEFPEFCPSIIFGMTLQGSNSTVLPQCVILFYFFVNWLAVCC